MHCVGTESFRACVIQACRRTSPWSRNQDRWCYNVRSSRRQQMLRAGARARDDACSLRRLGLRQHRHHSRRQLAPGKLPRPRTSLAAQGTCGKHNASRRRGTVGRILVTPPARPSSPCHSRWYDDPRRCTQNACCATGCKIARSKLWSEAVRHTYTKLVGFRKNLLDFVLWRLP
jgi:hypothetical protein